MNSDLTVLSKLGGNELEHVI